LTYSTLHVATHLAHDMVKLRQIFTSYSSKDKSKCHTASSKLYVALSVYICQDIISLAPESSLSEDKGMMPKTLC